VTRRSATNCWQRLPKPSAQTDPLRLARHIPAEARLISHKIHCLHGSELLDSVPIVTNLILVKTNQFS
jgi:hypothetical protein